MPQHLDGVGTSQAEDCKQISARSAAAARRLGGEARPGPGALSEQAVRRLTSVGAAATPELGYGRRLSLRLA